MAAQADLSLHSAHQPYSRIKLYVPAACMALLVVIVGAAGLVAHSWPRQIVESWINIHVLFGLLLCGWVIIGYHSRVKQVPRLQPSDVREVSRQLSRRVYLLLYIVIAVRQIIGIVHRLWHGGADDFSLLDEHFRNGPDSNLFDPKDDFQLFLASGLFVLVFVRLLAFRLWLRVTEHLVTSKTSESKVSSGRATEYAPGHSNR
jgi:cytochrome b561